MRREVRERMRGSVRSERRDVGRHQPRVAMPVAAAFFPYYVAGVHCTTPNSSKDSSGT
jgi:hypothetical protein